MRIVAGRFGGRTLATPATRDIRPTSDRLREAIFNRLAHGFDDACANARVIDLFAGTGALGLEALSRGAVFCLFVDEGAEARSLIRGNVETLGVGGITRIFRRDARNLGAAPAGSPFTLALLDPPYGRGLVEPALAALASGGWLAPDALCVIEESAEASFIVPPPFEEIDRRTYGDTQAIFAKLRP